MFFVNSFVQDFVTVLNLVSTVQENDDANNPKLKMDEKQKYLGKPMEHEKNEKGNAEMEKKRKTGKSIEQVHKKQSKKVWKLHPENKMLYSPR